MTIGHDTPTHTPGPWRWELSLNSKHVELCGGPPKSGFGKYDLTVMSFARYGMTGAAPVFWDWEGTSGSPRRADALGAVVEGREHHARWFQDVNHPDARLIAAAPDLLAACLRLISVNDECVAAVQRGEDLTPLGERFSDTLPAVRAAIAKATAQPTHLKEL